MHRPDPTAPAFVAPREAAIKELLGAPGVGVGFLARAWGVIPVVEGSLRVLGYRRTLRWIEAIPARRRGGGASVELGERLVRQAYRAHAFEGGCLPRSLVQYLLHRRDGTAARFVVGVRRPAEEGPANERPGRGIEAHAWVDRGSDARRPEVAPAQGPGDGQRRFAPIFDSARGRPHPSFD